MGKLTIPKNSKVYLDTVAIIYSVEKHADYWKCLIPFWQSLKAGQIAAYTSELTLLETLVQPLKLNNQNLVSAYETLLTKTDIFPVPISQDILRQSAELRAGQNFKTPDAIHAATAFSANCDYFITNDRGFNRLTNINVIILSDII